MHPTLTPASPVSPKSSRFVLTNPSQRPAHPPSPRYPPSPLSTRSHSSNTIRSRRSSRLPSITEAEAALTGTASPRGTSASRRHSSAGSGRVRRRPVPLDGTQLIRRSSSGQSILAIRDAVERKAVMRKGLQKKSLKGQVGHVDMSGCREAFVDLEIDQRQIFEEPMAHNATKVPDGHDEELQAQRRGSGRSNRHAKMLKKPGLGKLETRLRELASRLPASPQPGLVRRKAVTTGRVRSPESPNDDSSRWALRCS